MLILIQNRRGQYDCQNESTDTTNWPKTIFGKCIYQKEFMDKEKPERKTPCRKNTRVGHSIKFACTSRSIIYLDLNYS